MDADDGSDSKQPNGKRRELKHPTGNEGSCRNREVKYYDVERILERKVIGGVKMFLIKWKGYNKAKDWTWEPARTMEVDIPEMVKKFERAIEYSPPRTRRSGR
jgi:hypothetical protein